MLRRTLLVLVAALLGCTDVPLGVRSVDITLAPVPAASVPTGLDPAVLGVLARSSATLHVDPPAHHGIATAQGLPPLPEGWRYGLLLELEHTERGGLPGAAAGGEGTGHSHGALTALEQSGRSMIDLGAPTIARATTEWHFSEAHVAGHALGAVRAATVHLVDPAGGTHAVLHGALELEETGGEAAPAGGGGHDHGA